MKDFLGQEINIGDTVVVAATSGSSTYLYQAEVIGFTPHYVKINRGWESKKDPTKLIVVK